MNPEIEQLKKEIAALHRKIDLLSSFTTIPFTVEKAFKERLGINGLQEKLVDSGVAPSVYTETVDQGMGSADVLAAPDYILRMKFSNLTVAIPAFDF